MSFCALRGGEPATVHPDEMEAYPEAVDKRREEFRLGRAAAHRAIATLCGSSDQPIGRGARGQPLWPAGLVGAISHCRGLAVAAVARREHASGLGVDVERRDRRVTPEVARLVASSIERDWIEAEDAALRLKLLFSAKESIFKALYPLAEVYLGYKDAELAWKQAAGFDATLLVDGAPGWPAGSTLPVGARLDGDYLLTWVMLPP